MTQPTRSLQEADDGRQEGTGRRGQCARGRPARAAYATWCWSAIPGAGKTTLVEALLAATGTIQRSGRVEDGTTVSDFDEVEVRQQRSVNLTLAPLIHDGIKVNLLDTPGYADFTGDLRAGLRAADAALFAVSATDGIDGADPDAVGGVRRGRHAARRRDHQDRPSAGRLRRGWTRAARRSATRVAPLYLPVAANGHRHRADRAAVPALLQLLRRRPHRGRDPRPRDADRMSSCAAR